VASISVIQSTFVIQITSVSTVLLLLPCHWAVGASYSKRVWLQIFNFETLNYSAVILFLGMISALCLSWHNNFAWSYIHTYIHTHVPLHFINPSKPLGFGYETCPHDLTKTVRCSLTNTYKVKVKQSINRPGQFLRVPGGWGYQISGQPAHEDVKVVRSTRRPPLPQGKIPGTYLCWRLS